MEEKKFNKTAYDNEFIKNNYDRINLTVPKGMKVVIEDRAGSMGVNAYIRSLIEKDLKENV